MIDKKKKPQLKYKLKLIINEHRIGTKPYILNTLGNICEAFLMELRDIPEKETFNFLISPTAAEGEKVKILAAEHSVSLQGFVQDLILKTIIGFVSTLQKIPEDLEHSQIKIEFERK